MLNDSDSNQLLNACTHTEDIRLAFEIVKGTGAKLGVDGNQYFYGFGELPEQTGVYGFGKTPSEALIEFMKAFYSQKIGLR